MRCDQHCVDSMGVTVTKSTAMLSAAMDRSAGSCSTASASLRRPVARAPAAPPSACPKQQLMGDIQGAVPGVIFAKWQHPATFMATVSGFLACNCLPRISISLDAVFGNEPQRKPPAQLQGKQAVQALGPQHALQEMVCQVAVAPLLVGGQRDVA